MKQCRLCGGDVHPDENGTLIDTTGSDVCDAGGPHELDGEHNELLDLAVLDFTGLTDDVPGMPDFLDDHG